MSYASSVGTAGSKIFISSWSKYGLLLNVMFFNIGHHVRTAIKFVADILLFFVGYKIQREWVFK